MSHKQQVNFCKQVRKKFPSHFNRVNVIDCGSLDINGNNRYLFKWSNYIGIDIVDGVNVDVVGKISDKITPITFPNAPWKMMMNPDKVYNPKKANTIISTEMLEHDEEWAYSLDCMYAKLLPGGLLLITAAGQGRREHGTHQHEPTSSPGTLDYYRNITNEMFSSILPPRYFKEYYMNQDPANNDFQFYGIKRLG